MAFQSLIKIAALSLCLGMSGVNGGFVSDVRAQLPGMVSGAGMQQETASFVSPYGAQVSVDYYLPKNAMCPMPAVIILHGSDGGRRYAESYHKVGKALAANGYAAFLVNYFEGAPGMPLPDLNITTVPNKEAFHAWKSTVESGVDFVSNFPGVDRNRVGVIGFSLGGFIGSSIVTQDSRIDSLVVLSGGMPPSGYSHIHRGMAKTLIVHGNQDADVPVQEAYRYDAALNAAGIPHETLILDCEGHLPYRAHRSFVADKVLEFLSDNL